MRPPFKRLDEQGEINLYYLDETGFCLISSVPYAWQNIGKYLSISSRPSQRLNVFVMNHEKLNNLDRLDISNETKLITQISGLKSLTGKGLVNK